MAASDHVYEWLAENGDPGGDSYKAANTIEEALPDLGVRHESVARYVQRWRNGEVPSEYRNLSSDDTISSDDTTGSTDTPDASSVFLEDYLHRENVHYNEADDVYVIWMQNRAKPMPLDGDDYRAMKRAYSNWDGDESTIKEIMREFSISKPDFDALRLAAGWVHDSAPYADEEIIDGETAEGQDLLEDMLQRREQRIYRKWQKAKWKETEKEAQKWRSFEKETIEPLLEGVHAAPKRRGRAFEPSNKSEPVLAHFFETDRHLEGRTLEGGFEENKRVWHGCLQEALSRVCAFKRPERIVIVLGSDQFNVDTHHNTTTNGTSQDQSLGQREAVAKVAEAGCEAIEMMRDVAPTVVRVIPGNHDRRTARAYLWGLQARYDDCEDVKVRGRCEPYQYESYGNNLLAWHHGDGIGGGSTHKESNLTSKMVSDVPELIGETSHRYWFVGHEHRMWADEGASLVEMAPTTKARDEWEDFKGFPEGHRGSVGWVFEKSGGQSARFMGLVDHINSG